MKIGDNFICKYNKPEHRFFFGNTYVITYISDPKMSTSKRCFVTLYNDDIKVDVWLDLFGWYFYTLREVRKKKLENLGV